VKPSTYEDDVTTDHERNVLGDAGREVNQRRSMLWEAGQN